MIHQVACERDESLASASTLCRFENSQDRRVAWAVNEATVEQFIASHKKLLPAGSSTLMGLIPGLMASRRGASSTVTSLDLPLLPALDVFWRQPEAYRAAATSIGHAAAILKLLVIRLRREWPRTKIVFVGTVWAGWICC